MDIWRQMMQPWHFVTYLNRLKLGKAIPDKLLLACAFRERMGYWMDFRHPRTLNEKIQWLKLYDRNPLYTVLADKRKVKKYVADKIGKKYIIPTLGVWKHFEEINFDFLPDRFVLKCTHDSGSAVIVKNKSCMDKEAARKKLEAALETNYYQISREWAYKNIRPEILAEQFIEEKLDGGLKDYKIYNFGGKPYLIQVDFDRFCGHKRNLYSTDWNYIRGEIEYPSDEHVVIERPEVLDEMLWAAEKLSRGIPFIRTDFYLVRGRILFGELTLYHGSGFETFTPERLGMELGNCLKLPGRRRLRK